jgi:hypothetical protein
VTLGGQSVDTGTATVTQGVATVASTGISGYDSSDLPVIVPGDATRPERKVAPEGPITWLANPTVSNPLTASSDNSVTFSQQAREVWVRNLTAVDVYVDADTAASTSSWPVLAGESVCLGIFATVLHVYPTGSGVNVNQAGGLFVRGGI